MDVFSTTSNRCAWFSSAGKYSSCFSRKLSWPSPTGILMKSKVSIRWYGSFDVSNSVDKRRIPGARGLVRNVMHAVDVRAASEQLRLMGKQHQLRDVLVHVPDLAENRDRTQAVAHPCATQFHGNGLATATHFWNRRCRDSLSADNKALAPGWRKGVALRAVRIESIRHSVAVDPRQGP